VPVGSFDVVDNTFAFTSTLSFSPDLPPGDHELLFRAVAADGTVGPPQTLALKVDDQVPAGKLVIQLDWDTEADLDLHVRIPDADATNGYFDVWAKGPRALPPPKSGDPAYTEAQLDAGGQLLFDSNAQCVIDGARHEEVVFPTDVPPGPYEVRVDTFSLCGEATARWHVAAFTNTGDVQIIAEAFGQSTDRDTVSAHTGGSGTLALTFTP